MTFIEDKEINLHEEDILQTKPYAESLKNTILNAPTPFNIGLYGEWGSGKSSIISTVQKELENSENPKIKFVVYDAWKYANDSFRRMFLKTLQEKLQFDGTELFESFYQNSAQDKKIEQKFNWKYLWLILGFGFVSIVLTFFFFKTDDKTAIITLQSILTIMTALIAFFKNAFVDYKLTISKPAMFAPEQFEDAFKEIVTWAFNQKSLLHPYKWIKEKSIFEKPIEKLIIIIDNIDRCDRKTAYDLLTNIKNFVSEEQKIIFLVPVDDEALKRHMQEHNKENGKEADEFLRKFFNTTVKIKHFQPRDLFEYADSLNQKYSLGFNPDTINIVAKEYASNPRRIIQLFNNLIFELKALEAKHQNVFCEKNQSLIAKLLIIREEWANIFKKITEQPHLFLKYEEIFYDINDKNEKFQFELFKQFMQKTRAIISDIQTIEKIVLNITNESTLSTELVDIIALGDLEKLLHEIENDSIYNKTVNYIIDEFRKALDRKIYTDASNSLVLLSKINDSKKTPKAFLRKISGFFHNEHEIISVFEYLHKEDLKNIFSYIETNRIYGLDYLQNIIILKLQNEWNTPRDDSENIPSIWLDGFEHIINYSADQKIIKTLQPIFINYYDYYYDSPIYDGKWVNEDKLPWIVSDHLINYLVNKIKNSIDEKSDVYKELIYFGELKLLNIKNIENLFKKIIPNFSQQIVSINPQEEKLKLLKETFSNVKLITNLLHKLSMEKIDSEPIKLYIQEILKPMNILLNTNTRSFQQLNLIQDIASNEENQKELLLFYIEIYRATLGTTNVVSNITALISQYQNIKNDFYLELISLRNSHGLGLIPFFDYLISQLDDNSNLFDLYQKLFLKADVIKNNSEKIKSKLSELINKLLSGENELLENFIVALMKNQSTKDLLAEIITSKTPDEMVQLPSTIKHIAYDYLCENDKIFDLEDNIEAIKDIVNFDPKYNEYILNIVKSKVLNPAKVADALEIIHEMKNLSDMHKEEIVRELKKQNKHETLSEEVKALIKELKPKATRSTPPITSEA